MNPLALAAALFAALPAHAASSEADLTKLIQKLNERLDNLEKRNAELEKQIQADHAAKVPADIEKRVQSLEQAQEQVNKALDSDEISQYEPELTSRLKAAEKDVLETRKAVKRTEGLEGLKAGAGLTAVAQMPSGLPKGTADGNSQLN